MASTRPSTCSGAGLRQLRHPLGKEKPRRTAASTSPFDTSTPLRHSLSPASTHPPLLLRSGGVGGFGFSGIGAISRSSVGLVIFWSVFRTSGASRSSLAMAAPSVAFSAATSGFGGRLALCSSKSPAFIGRTIGALTGSPAASVSKATNSALYWTVTSRADRGAPPRTNSGANAMFRRRTALSSLYRSSAPGRWMPKGVAFHHVVAEVGSGAIPNGGSFDGQLAGCMGRGCPQP
jgi:hypothetical protein